MSTVAQLHIRCLSRSNGAVLAREEVRQMVTKNESDLRESKWGALSEEEEGVVPFTTCQQQVLNDMFAQHRQQLVTRPSSGNQICCWLPFLIAIYIHWCNKLMPIAETWVLDCLMLLHNAFSKRLDGSKDTGNLCASDDVVMKWKRQRGDWGSKRRRRRRRRTKTRTSVDVYGARLSHSCSGAGSGDWPGGRRSCDCADQTVRLPAAP